MDILRNLLGISELDSDLIQREALRQRLELSGLELNETLPYLLQILGLLQSDPILELRIKLLEPAMLQRQIHVAVRLMLLAEARRSPMVIVFDDLHWIDQASQQFLEYLCLSIDEVPILLVLVARDFEQFEHAQEIWITVQKRFRKPLEIKVTPLPREDSVLLVDQLIQENSYRAEQLKATIVQRADGNPYYIEELVRVLIDHGAMVNDGSSWHVTARAGQLISQVPATLQDIILARFDLLPFDQQRLLQVAAALGSSFGLGLFQEVVETEVEQLTTGLNDLEGRGFLLQTRFGTEYGFAFKHPMLRDVVYATMLKSNLRQMHSRIAQCVEGGEHWLPGERSEFLAHHYALGTDPKKAVPYLLNASKKASLNFANEAVIYLSRQALELMHADPAYPAGMQAGVRVSLATALKFTGEFDEAANLLSQVIEEEEHALSRLGSSGREELILLVGALRELGDIRAREGSYDQAVDLLTHGLELLGPDAGQVFPLQWCRLADRLAWVYFRKSKLDEAYNLVEHVLLDQHALESDDPITLASLYNTIGGIYWTRKRCPRCPGERTKKPRYLPEPELSLGNCNRSDQSGRAVFFHRAMAKSTPLSGTGGSAAN